MSYQTLLQQRSALDHKASRLSDIATPAAIIDLDRLERNCERMLARARQFGVILRPHLKTAKCAEIARLATGRAGGPITVSTLSEVAYFGRAGYRDITYAVGIAPAKIRVLGGLQHELDIRVNLLVDSVAGATAAAEAARKAEASFAVLIEIDCGGGRGGVAWDGSELLPIAEALSEASHLSLAGVLTHGGHSYGASDVVEIERIAEDERLAATGAAQRLRDVGFAVDTVSVGSTPTATFARSLEGVTEIRPGVYTFFDLHQVLLQVCDVDDIAVSVLTTVIGQNPRSCRLLVDAGALALSKDLSANDVNRQFGYGLVCGIGGSAPIPGLRVSSVHQEHGLIAADDDCTTELFSYVVGTRLRILPNHACMTVAPYDRYYVVRGRDDHIIAEWDKAVGWEV